MNTPRTHPPPLGTDAGSRATLQFTIVVGVLVFALMMIVGITMRASQATVIGLAPGMFYQLMTLHGAGMVGAAGLGGALVMWALLRQHVRLSTRVFQTMMALSLIGVVLIIGAILLGGFAAGWTFLYPLPAKSMGLWSTASAAAFVLGLTLIGVGFLLFYGDCALAVIRAHGSLWRSLGVPQLINGRVEEAPSAAVIASTMVIIVNVVGILAGAVVLVMTLVNLFVPSMVFSALLMKNLIFFFGHVFINASIYMAVIAVYELLPRYTGRPWKVSRLFIAAWLAAVFMVTSVYPHHLLMDGVMPSWALVLGQVMSYLSGIPVLAVTAWGTLANIARSGMRWQLAPAFLVLGVFGWSVGVIPAVIDGMIVVNHVMHNTLWVPGHFHTYLLLGLLPMLFGFILHTVQAGSDRGLVDRVAFWIYTLAGSVFCLAFLYGGLLGVPRRFAVHAPQWMAPANIGTLGGALVVLAAAWFVARALVALTRARMPAVA